MKAAWLLSTLLLAAMASCVPAIEPSAEMQRAEETLSFRVSNGGRSLNFGLEPSGSRGTIFQDVFEASEFNGSDGVFINHVSTSVGAFTPGLPTNPDDASQLQIFVSKADLTGERHDLSEVDMRVFVASNLGAGSWCPRFFSTLINVPQSLDLCIGIPEDFEELMPPPGTVELQLHDGRLVGSIDILLSNVEEGEADIRVELEIDMPVQSDTR